MRLGIECEEQTGECSKGEFEVHGPPRVQYLNFCTVIQPGESLGRSRRVVLTDDQKQMMLALNEQTRESKRQMKNEYGFTELPKSPLAVIPLSETGDAQLTGIMSRILRRLRATKGSMRQYFGDFESRKVHSDVGKRPATAAMNHSMGCISRTQFERCIFNLCQLSERFEQAELALLFRKYEKCGKHFVIHVFITPESLCTGTNDSATPAQENSITTDLCAMSSKPKPKLTENNAPSNLLGGQLR